MVSFSVCLELQYYIIYIKSYRQILLCSLLHIFTPHTPQLYYSKSTTTQLDFNVFHNIMHNPKVSHECFKVGLAASIAIVFLKGYVELYKGKKQGKKVEYENFKTATHCTILLILLSWISFHLSLSPVYGTVKTWLIMIGFGWGVLIQCALFIPVSAQNIISVVFMTYFLHVYK